MTHGTASIILLLLALHATRLCEENPTDLTQPISVLLKCWTHLHTKLSLCDNKNFLGNPFKIRSFKISPLKPRPRTVILLMLILCGDVELNPGPGNSSYYPCGFCERKVSWSDKGVCCDDCSLWYHKSCISMRSADYDKLESLSWHCIKCQCPLNSTFTFHSYEISTANRFESLSTIPGDDSVFMPSLSSLSSPGTPRWQSSPYSVKGSKSKSSAKSSANNGDDPSQSTSLPRKPHNNLRILIINSNGIRARKAELEHATEYIKPEIILINETKLDKNINSSEFLPECYTFHCRKDRSTDGGGGVMIAAHRDIDISEI